MTLPSAIVGGTDFANSTSSSSLHSCLSVTASNAATRPGTGFHCPSPKGIDVQTMPLLLTFAETELYLPGMPSVGGLASVPEATREGDSPSCPVARSYLNDFRKSFSAISYT